MKRLPNSALEFVILSVLVSSTAFSQQQSIDSSSMAFRNTNLSIDERVNDLIGRMTLGEKVKQMLYDAPAIKRLAVPEYNWWNEGLHGVARAGRATVFPQSIGLAAAWDTGLMHEIATAISDEARAKHNESLRKGRHGIYEGLTFWSPNINIFRDPRWGRGMETFGEDPHLSGRLAVEFVKGMQGDDPRYLKTIATPKHFAVHSGPDPERHTFNAIVDERDLRDTYLPQFRAAVKEGHAQSVMCAYNRFRGLPCCGSDELLRKILRDEWEFDGYVVSDCWAIMDFYNTHRVVKTAPEAAAMALKAGTDLNCGVTFDSLGVAVKEGLVNEDLVNQAVTRLFRARFRLGMFDPPGSVPYDTIPIAVVENQAHRKLALEAARRSIVLLKNDREILPLRKDLHRIAVIGPNANDADLLLGNYNGIPSHAVTPLEGITRKVGDHAEILYARGCEVADNMPTLEPVPASSLSAENGMAGLKGEYFDNNGLGSRPVLVRNDSVIDFNWWDQPASPELAVDTFSVRWSGIFTPPAAGKYSVGLTTLGDARLFLDESLAVGIRSSHEVSTKWKDIEFKAGEPHRIRVEYNHSRPYAMVRFVWSKPDPDLHEQAMDAARRADVTVMCLGLSPRLEGEEMDVHVPGFSGGDRVELGLPRTQEELLESVASLGKPIVLVLLNGSALAINWAAEHVHAIIEAWYPGQEGGHAIADVLFGDYNPSGRLPVTFYKSADQLPPFTDYRMTGRTYRYFTGEPLYPFGFGLSYSNFQYSHLRLPDTIRTGDTVHVEVDVENTGGRVGSEVVELYIITDGATVPVPIRSLQGFQRVLLKPGEKQTVSFAITPRQLSLIDAGNVRVLEPGEFEVSVGGKQPSFSGRADAATTGVLRSKFRVTGSPLVIGENQ